MRTLIGWCPPEKARELTRLIERYRPAVAVEIGVFGGSSLIPMAEAIRPHGTIHAIDPWTTAAVVEAGAGGPAHAEWWANVNLDDIYAGFVAAVAERKLERVVKIHRKTADAAAQSLPLASIDLLHIDGNHAEATSQRDARTWLPRVKPGGWVVMDDTGPKWPSTAKAVAILNAGCHLIRDWGEWRVYRKKW